MPSLRTAADRTCIMALGVALLGLTSTAGAKTYSDLTNMVQTILRMNSVEGVHATPKVVYRDSQGKPQPAVFVVHAAQGDQLISLGIDGHLAIAVDDALLKENPQVDLQANGVRATGTVEVSIDFEVEAKPSLQFSKADYEDMLNRYAAARATQGFFTRMSMPKPTGITVTLSEGAGAQAINSATGLPEKIRESHPGTLEISDQTIRGTRTPIEFSQMPRTIELSF